MKYMFASDIHGSAYYCREMLRAFREEKADRLVLLGDLLYHGPRNDLPKDYAPKEVIAMLNEVKDFIYAVRGNCEAEVDQMVLEFPVMADYCILVLESEDILCYPRTCIQSGPSAPYPKGRYSDPRSYTCLQSRKKRELYPVKSWFCINPQGGKSSHLCCRTGWDLPY